MLVIKRFLLTSFVEMTLKRLLLEGTHIYDNAYGDEAVYENNFEY